MKRSVVIGLILLLLLVPFTTSIGQSSIYPIRKFNAEHGLEYVILKIEEDTSGFVWLMYRNKIQRFDGKNTDIYFEGEKSLSLFVDSQENVWVTTRKGVFRFDRKTNRFLKIEIQGIAQSTIVFEPEIGTLFCISESKLYVYNESTNQFILSKIPSHQLHPEIQVYFRKFSYTDYTLYYSIKDTILRHNIQTGSVDKLPVQDLRSILAISEDEIIVNTWLHKAWYYNFKTQKRLYLSTSIDPFLLVSDIVAVDETAYYLATSKGILAYTKGTDYVQQIPLSFDGKPIPIKEYTALYKGKNDIIWGSDHSSLLSFDPSGGHINFIQSDDSNLNDQFNNSVRSFAEDELGNLWLATVDGLAYWDMKNNQFSTIKAKENAKHELNHSSIRGLAYDGTHLIVGQTKKGIWLYNPKKKTFDRPVFENNTKGLLLQQRIEKAFIYQIKTLRNGDHIVTADNGAYLIKAKNYTVKLIDYLESDHHTKFAFQGIDNIFIGTTKGLYCFDNKLTYQYTIKDVMTNPSVNCMLEWDEGYYLGTQQGLYFFSIRENKVHIKKVIPALENQQIRTLFKDDQNILWIVTKNKLHQYFPKTGQMKTYGYSEHIRGGPFYRNSYIRKSDGQVFLGTLNGINYFYPERINIHPTKLSPYIRDIHVHKLPDSIINFERVRHLKQNQNTISINFSTPYYGNQKAITYRYQLVENGEWFSNGNQSNLTLWQLPPGDYQFWIAATLNNAVWHTSKEKIRFSIPPPFWKSWWFSIAIILFVCSILYGVFRSFKRKLKMEKELLVNKNLAFRAQMNPHFIFNSLNSIQYLIANNNGTGANNYLIKFSRLIRSVLESTFEEKVILDEEIKLLKTYLVLESLRFDNGFTYTIEVDDTLNIYQVEVPLLIIQPFVENAIVHGLLRKERGPKELGVYFKEDEVMLICQIIDNGIGRKAAGKLQKAHLLKRKSRGLEIAYNRLITLFPEVKEDEFIHINDLYDQNNHPIGTEVTIKIPKQ